MAISTRLKGHDHQTELNLKYLSEIYTILNKGAWHVLIPYTQTVFHTYRN